MPEQTPKSLSDEDLAALAHQWEGTGSATMSTSRMTSVTASKMGRDGFGLKRITWFGSLALIVNNITGPAIVDLPPVFQEAGWFTPLLLMLTVLVISSLASAMLCEVMTAIPGNSHFQGRIELATLCDAFFPKWGYYCVQFLMNVCLLSLNVSSIIVSAQTMDFTLVALFGWSGAFEFLPHFGFVSFHSSSSFIIFGILNYYYFGTLLLASSLLLSFLSSLLLVQPFYSPPMVTEAGTSVSPFTGVVISLGFVIVLLLCIPLGYFNLDDNVIVQEVALMTVIIFVTQWVVEFCIMGLHPSRVPFVGSNQSQVLGTVIFNYAFVITIPSWVNEKKENVSVNGAIWTSGLLSTFLFVLLGVFGGWALQFNSSTTSDLLDALQDQTTGTLNIISKYISMVENDSTIIETLTRPQISVYLFPPIVILSGIPIYSIIIRYNLMETNICNKNWANFWGVIFPWIISFPLCTGEGIQLVINWTSLLFNGSVNFVVPFLLYMAYRVGPPLEAFKGVNRIESTYLLGENDPDSAARNIYRTSEFADDIVSMMNGHGEEEPAQTEEKNGDDYGGNYHSHNIFSSDDEEAEHHISSKKTKSVRFVSRGNIQDSMIEEVSEHSDGRFKAIPMMETPQYRASRFGQYCNPLLIAVLFSVLVVLMVAGTIVLDLVTFIEGRNDDSSSSS